MPLYHLHDLRGVRGDIDPVSHMFHGDDAAMRYAMRPDFPAGCDVWRGGRFVGRVHRPAGDRSKAATPQRTGPAVEAPDWGPARET